MNYKKITTCTVRKGIVTCMEKGGAMRTRARPHAHTLPNLAAIGPEIEFGAVNRLPLQVLFPLSRGGSWTTAGQCVILLHSTHYVREVDLYQK